MKLRKLKFTHKKSEKIRYGSGSGTRPSFDMDPDPDPEKNNTDPDLERKGFSKRKI